MSSTAQGSELVGTVNRDTYGLDFKGGAVDTRSPQGKLLLNVFGAFAQFEREVMLERQREGIAKAKAEGRCKGRKPTAQAKAMRSRP